MNNISYRNLYNNRLEDEKKSLHTVIRIVMIVVTIFLVKDLLINFYHEATITVTWVRVSFILLSFISLLNFKRIKDFRHLCYGSVAWLLFYFALKLSVNVILGQKLASYLFFDSIIILAIYTIIPLYLKGKLTMALFFTVIDIVIFFNAQELLALNKFNVLFAFLSANVVGFFAARIKEQSIYERYKVYLREHELLERLHLQVEEVNRLSGLLPICGSCKSVRDDQGYWQRVDEYLAENAGIVLTHGVCPNCADEQLEEFKKKSQKNFQN